MRESLFLILLLFSFGSLYPQTNGNWTESEGSCPLENVTPAEARKQALDMARRNAIEFVCGSEIVSETITQNFMLGADVIANLASGFILEEDTLEWFKEDLRTAPDQPFSEILHVKIKAKVACDTGKTDPGFRLDAKLNRIHFKNGDTLQLAVIPTRDCFIHIFNMTGGGEMYQIYPLKQSLPEKLNAGEKWVYPAPLLVQLPPNTAKTQEMIYILATRQPLMLTTSFNSETVQQIGPYRVWARPETCWQDLVKNLLTIPRKERTATTLIYNIYDN